MAPGAGENGLTSRRPSGAGIGLRTCHMDLVLAEAPLVPWFELLADNHLAAGGWVRAATDAVAERWPITLHCVAMNVAGQDPLDVRYLTSIRQLAGRLDAAWVSDHLCFTACHGRHFHDLLPFPYDDASLSHVTARVQQIQEIIGRPLVLENVSAYLRFNGSTLDEAQFLNELVFRTDCRILLDLNNLYVNHVNHGESVAAYLGALPMHAVQELHLGGHESVDGLLIDAHNNPVSRPVWNLYRDVLTRLPEVPVLLEWDNRIPPFSVLAAEAARAEAIRRRPCLRADAMAV